MRNAGPVSHRVPGSRCHQPHMTAPERQQPWPGPMRQSTADHRTRLPPAPGCGSPPLVHPRPQGQTRGAPPLPTDPTPRRLRPAPRRMPATRPPARPRRPHRPRHRRTAPPLHHRHEPDGILRLACKTRRASRCPSCAEIYRADTYQLIRAGLGGGKGVPATVAQPPVRVRHPHRPLLRPGPHPPGTRRQGTALPSRRDAAACPHGVAVLHAGTPATTTARRTAVPGLLRLHRLGAVQRRAPELWRRFTIALRRTSPATPGSPAGRSRPGPGLLRQGRRVPATRRRPLPRGHPPRRPRRTGHHPARLGHPRPADRRHRHAARAVPVDTPRRTRTAARTSPGAASSTPARSPPPGS